jgi:hypothetical protein
MIESPTLIIFSPRHHVVPSVLVQISRLDYVIIFIFSTTHHCGAQFPLDPILVVRELQQILPSRVFFDSWKQSRVESQTRQPR